MLMLLLFVMGHHLGSGASSLLLPDQKAAKVKKIFGRVLRNKRPGLFANPRKRPLEWGDPACGETCCHAGCCTVEGHPCSCSRVAFRQLFWGGLVRRRPMARAAHPQPHAAARGDGPSCG